MTKKVNTDVKVGEKYKQIKAVPFPKFDHVGETFEIGQVVEGSGVVAKGMGMYWGATFEELAEYFEYVPEKVPTLVLEKVAYLTFEDDPIPAKVIQNGPATIVILEDGTRGVSKCLPTDEFDEETGIEIAYVRARIKQLQKELKTLIK